MGPEMGGLLQLYRALAWPEKLVWRGGSWRLPSLVAERYVTKPFLDICDRNGMTSKFCMRNLVETY